MSERSKGRTASSNATRGKKPGRLSQEDAIVEALLKVGIWGGDLYDELIGFCRLSKQNLAFLVEGGWPTRRFVGLCLAARHFRPSLTPPLAEMAGYVISQRRRPLLNDLWGTDLGGLAVLRRLPGEFLPANAYGDLAALLATPEGRMSVMSVGALNAKRLARLREVGVDPLLHFNTALVASVGARQLAFLFTGLRKIRSDLDPTDLHMTMDRLTSLDGVDRMIGRLLLPLPLPKPPWEGTVGIRPIVTVRALRRAGLTMRNCLNDAMLWADALRGRHAYYWCDGAQPAVASLTYHRLFQLWSLEEICGARSGPLRPAAKLAIAERFAAAGFPDLSNGNNCSMVMEEL